jgi:hypothetical protein
LLDSDVPRLAGGRAMIRHDGARGEVEQLGSAFVALVL